MRCVVEGVGPVCNPLKKDDRVYTFRSVSGAYAELSSA